MTPLPRFTPVAPSSMTHLTRLLPRDFPGTLRTSKSPPRATSSQLVVTSRGQLRSSLPVNLLRLAPSPPDHPFRSLRRPPLRRATSPPCAPLRWGAPPAAWVPPPWGERSAVDEREAGTRLASVGQQPHEGEKEGAKRMTNRSHVSVSIKKFKGSSRCKK